MNPSPPANVTILVVEEDESLRETFAEVLAEGGYRATFVSSLKEAYASVDTQTYALVLADLFAGRSPYEFSDAHRLRRYVSPTPIGLLTTQPITSDDAQRAGFAFGLSLPFDIDALLDHVAVAINQPLACEQMQRVETIERYFAALENEDWMTLLSLCTDDVAYYPPHTSPITISRRLRGKSAMRAYAQSSAEHYRNIAFTNLRFYPCPKGIVARFVSAWTTPDDYWRQAAETVHFHFDGQRICQIGVRVNLAVPATVTHTAG